MSVQVVSAQLVGSQCVTTGPANCRQCCERKDADGSIRRDPSCFTPACSPYPVRDLRPTQVAANKVMATSAKITWKDSLFDSKDTRYSVICKEGEAQCTSGGGISVTGIPRFVESATVTGLKKDVLYTCWVEATTGPESEPLCSDSSVQVGHFYTSDNGVTMMCPKASLGQTATIGGVTYWKLDEKWLRIIVAGGSQSIDWVTTVCTSGITNMTSLFADQADFNSDISSWDTSSVTRMSFMFYRAKSFNQDIGAWDTSNVREMDYMFQYAAAFNQDIGRWDTSSVFHMSHMFNFADVFNQDISGWNTDNVEEMDFMFDHAFDFNQDIGSWNLARCNNTRGMFNFAYSFNQDIGRWNTSLVYDSDNMFHSAYSFNQDISGWDVSRVTDMGAMFLNATSFNADISSWDTRSVTTLRSTFNRAVSFNQDLSKWDVSQVEIFRLTFSRAESFNQDIGGWNTEKAKDMYGMFSRAKSFNQNLSDWCVINLVESPPGNFTTDSGMTDPAFLPVWGTCP